MNEQIFRDFIAEQNAEALTVDWVNWMLDVLVSCDMHKKQLNPEWLRAPGHFIYDTEPTMIYEQTNKQTLDKTRPRNPKAAKKRRHKPR